MFLNTLRPSVKSVTYSMYNGVPLGWIEVVTKHGSTIGRQTERLLTLYNYLITARSEYPNAVYHRRTQLLEIGKYNQSRIDSLEKSHNKKLRQWSLDVIYASDYYNLWAGYATMIEYRITCDVTVLSASDRDLNSLRMKYLNLEKRTLDLETGHYFYPQYSKMPIGCGLGYCDITDLPKIEGV